MKSETYGKYVHKFVDAFGITRYAVAEWDEKSGEYIVPLDSSTRKMNGGNVYAEFAKSLKTIGGYLTRQQALRRARYLFGEK